MNNAAIDTRNLSRALHRIDVDAAGMVGRCKIWLIGKSGEHLAGWKVKPSFRIEDDTAAAHLYRIAREAVINANKHAQAREIVVRLERSRRGMVLRVIDDGVGFPREPNPAEGLGYHIMKYRAHLMGGLLEIDSRKGGGTRVSCYLPKHAARSDKERKMAMRLADAMPNVSSVPVAGELTL